uniref:Transmembrane protein 44 n=1 Tax=Chelydra serpentina TaxID=8475 RepID=A0A8C3RN18_CHESE
MGRAAVPACRQPWAVTVLPLLRALRVSAPGSARRSRDWPCRRGRPTGRGERLALIQGAILTFTCFLQCRGRPSPVTQLWASISSALASVLYAAAIVTHDQRPAYFVRAMPWLLLSLGSAALDGLACLSCLMQSQMSQRLGLVAEATETPDIWPLLVQTEEEEPKGTEEEKVSPPVSGFSPALPRCTLVNPAPCSVQAGRGAVRLPGDGQTSAADPALPEPPAYPPVQIIHAKLSPSCSSDFSSISSELERVCYWEPLGDGGEGGERFDEEPGWGVLG